MHNDSVVMFWDVGAKSTYLYVVSKECMSMEWGQVPLLRWSGFVELNNQSFLVLHGGDKGGDYNHENATNLFHILDVHDEM